jgi:hypothetical protein
MPVVNPSSGREWTMDDYRHWKSQHADMANLLITGSQNPAVKQGTQDLVDNMKATLNVFERDHGLPLTT